MKFYICKHCGNIVTKLTSAGVPLHCCGEEMSLLEAGVTDAAVEKHVPAVTVEGNVVKVAVGSVTHPMTAEHYIPWVVLRTDKGSHRRHLSPEDAPLALFSLAEDEQPLEVYAWCNQHGLWKADRKKMERGSEA